MSIEGGALRKLKIQKDATLNRAPEEPLGPSFKELQDTDPNFPVFLDGYLKKSDAPLYKRAMEGTTTPKDEEKLIVVQQTYFERSKNGAELVGTLDDYMSEMLRESPAFREIIQFHGADVVDKALRDGLQMRALKDPKKFAVLQSEFKKLRDFENDVEKPLNKRLDDWCKKNNISIDNEALQKSLNKVNPAHRQAEIRHMLADGFTAKQRAWDGIKGLFGGGTKGQARAISRENIPQVLAQRDQIVKDAGEYARNLLLKDKEFQSALARTRAEQEPAFEGAPESMMKFQDVKGFKLDMKQASDELTLFLNKKGKSMGIPLLVETWSDRSEAEQDRYLEEFWNGNNETDPDKAWAGYGDRFPRPKGDGFFATLLSTMFGKQYYKDKGFKEELKKFEAKK